MNKHAINFIVALSFSGLTLTGDVGDAIAQSNTEKFFQHYDSAKVSEQDNKEFCDLVKIYKSQAQKDYENWPEGQINKKYLASASAKALGGLAATGGLFYAAVRYPRLGRFILPAVDPIALPIVIDSPAIALLICFPVAIPLGISVYIAKDDIEKGLHYKSFLKQKYEDLETIERRLQKQ